MKLGIQHCVHDNTPVQPQTPDSIIAQLMTQFRGQHIGLLAPLVNNRKGVYTELADWARPRGFTHLRVDGQFLPTLGFPRLDRFKEHTIELPVASLKVDPANEALLRQSLLTALEHGKGVVHVLSQLDGLQEALLAQEATTLDTVTVTGSRIKQTNAVTAQPVFVLDREKIAQTGVQSVGEILQQLTAGGKALNPVAIHGQTNGATVQANQQNGQQQKGRKQAQDQQ